MFTMPRKYIIPRLNILKPGLFNNFIIFAMFLKKKNTYFMVIFVITTELLFTCYWVTSYIITELYNNYNGSYLSLLIIINY